MRVYLVRHGESLWQTDHTADWDSGLSPAGHRQAAALAAWVTATPKIVGDERFAFSSLYSSPLRRAAETAGYIARATGCAAHALDCLAELPADITRQLPAATGPLDSHASLPDHSEEYEVLKKQARMVLELLTGAVRRTGGPVLAVTHSGVIGTMVRLVINSDLLTLKVFNGSITALEWREGHWQLRFLNLWDHLPYELRT